MRRRVALDSELLKTVPAGVYFTRLVSGGAVSGRRMAVID